MCAPSGKRAQKDVTNILAYEMIAGHLFSVSFTFCCLLIVSHKVNEATIIRVGIRRAFKLEWLSIYHTDSEGQFFRQLHIYIGGSIISYLQSS